MYTLKKELILKIAPLGTFLFICALFFQTRHFDFLNFDDDVYITQNSLVLEGISLKNIALAFQQSFGGHYHPLTWISHMLDVTLFGVSPQAFHIENIILHAFNCVLCFFIAHTLIKDSLYALFIALIFGSHPMRIESVAWLSERKDVLSMFFGLASLLCWLKAQSTLKFFFKILSLIFLTLSLLSKPTFMTLPLLLITIEVWQSQKFSFSMIREKIPFFLLSCVAGVLALNAQKTDGGLTTLSMISLSERINSSMMGYLIYLGKFFVPSSIGVFYPFKSYDPGVSTGAFLGLSSITYFFYTLKKQNSSLLFGWVWFLISLLPMIGIVQIGGQSYADRWSYLPHLGLLIGSISFLKDSKISSARLILSAVILSMTILTSINLPHWRDSKSIFSHTLVVSPDNFMAHTNLGSALDAEGNLSEAAYHFEEAWRLNPGYPEALNNIGRLRASQHRYSEAENFFQQAVNRKSTLLVARYNLALTKFERGDILGATEEWLRVLKHNQNHNQAQQSLRYVLNARKSELCNALETVPYEKKLEILDTLRSFMQGAENIC